MNCWMSFIHTLRNWTRKLIFYNSITFWYRNKTRTIKWKFAPFLKIFLVALWCAAARDPSEGFCRSKRTKEKETLVYVYIQRTVARARSCPRTFAKLVAQRRRCHRCLCGAPNWPVLSQGVDMHFEVPGFNARTLGGAERAPGTNAHKEGGVPWWPRSWQGPQRPGGTRRRLKRHTQQKPPRHAFKVQRGAF